MLKTLRRWVIEDKGVAAVEAGLMFPIMLTMMCGMIDMGVALIINMKVSNSSQVVSDLVAREATVSQVQVDDAIIAGQMTMQPYDIENFGIDVAGVQYVGEDMTPTVQWRDTINMEPNLEVTIRSEGLGDEGEGVVAVTSRYQYTPYFSGFILGIMTMEEEAYVRGRKGTFVAKV